MVRRGKKTGGEKRKCGGKRVCFSRHNASHLLIFCRGVRETMKKKKRNCSNLAADGEKEIGFPYIHFIPKEEKDSGKGSLPLILLSHRRPGGGGAGLLGDFQPRQGNKGKKAA